VAVVHGLTEREANEVMVLLEEQNIVGTMVAEEGEDAVTYAISVPPTDASAARRLLVANGLPRPSDPGYAEATAKTGMIPSAGDEKMKMLNAKQGEINNALMAIDGVLTARTLINLPESESLADGPPPLPTASVVLRVRRLELSGEEPIDPSVDEDKVKRIVANAVQGLDPEAVEVMRVVVTTVIPDKSSAPAASKGGGNENLFKLIALGGLAAAAVLALLLVLMAKQKKDLRRRVLAMQRQITDAGETTGARQAAGARG
jgi:type III secretion system YscJ/HrcJ family lipoprotein